FLPISMPITAIALLSFSDMACSLTLLPPGQLRLLAGAGARPDHPLTRPQSRSKSGTVNVAGPSGKGGASSTLPPSSSRAYHSFDATCQTRTLATLFDHLVGDLLKMQRHVNTKCLGGLDIDHQLQLRGLLDRQVSRLLALENPAGIDADLAIGIGRAGSIAHQ